MAFWLTQPVAKLATLLEQYLDRQPPTVVIQVTTWWETAIVHVKLMECGLGVNLPASVSQTSSEWLRYTPKVISAKFLLRRSYYCYYIWSNCGKSNVNRLFIIYQFPWKPTHPHVNNAINMARNDALAISNYRNRQTDCQSLSLESHVQYSCSTTMVRRPCSCPCAICQNLYLEILVSLFSLVLWLIFANIRQIFMFTISYILAKVIIHRTLMVKKRWVRHSVSW